MDWEFLKAKNNYFGCLVSVDGIDCHIQDLSPFSAIWYSYKFKGSELGYEVGLTVEDGVIV